MSGSYTLNQINAKMRECANIRNTYNAVNEKLNSILTDNLNLAKTNIDEAHVDFVSNYKSEKAVNKEISNDFRDAQTQINKIINQIKKSIEDVNTRIEYYNTFISNINYATSNTPHLYNSDYKTTFWVEGNNVTVNQTKVD